MKKQKPKTGKKVRVAILDDHQSIIDGYVSRLKRERGIQVVGTAHYGNELKTMLTKHPADVLILDIDVPTSESNENVFPFLQVVPDLITRYPETYILAISSHTMTGLVNALINAGVSGYIDKGDYHSIEQLGHKVRAIAEGNLYFSPSISERLRTEKSGTTQPVFTKRELQALSLCISYPNMTTVQLAEKLNVADSTVRNLLYHIYMRLNVNSRAAAIAKVRKMELFIEDKPKSLF